MKVTNHKVGGAPGKLDAGKAGKSEGAKALGKDLKAGGLTSAKDLKEGSNVEVSDHAQMMAKAKGIASDQTVDEAKVARLQKMIDEGKYNVDVRPFFKIFCGSQAASFKIFAKCFS